MLRNCQKFVAFCNSRDDGGSALARVTAPLQTKHKREAMFAKGATSLVTQAVRSVRREDFLPSNQRQRSGEDVPLPIGYAQTISQPSLVEEMTRELALNPRSRVLEIGTGSGYQTAILAEIAAAVFTVERILELAAAARERLDALGYHNIQYRVGDGALGWAEEAPFDAIIVTAAPATLPPILVDQLGAGGRMVVPVGPDLHSQRLLLVTRDEKGQIWQRELFGVRFVPLVSESPAPDQSQ
jgi:protein-L-isoaspartate(D-aspartate) O-methyltransferase